MSSRSSIWVSHSFTESISTVGGGDDTIISHQTLIAVKLSSLLIESALAVVSSYTYRFPTGLKISLEQITKMSSKVIEGKLVLRFLIDLASLSSFGNILVDII